MDNDNEWTTAQPEFMDKYSRRIIAWLESRPSGTCIEWTSDHFSVKEQYACGFIDIQVDPQVEKKLGMNYVWTIEGPGSIEEFGYDASLLWVFEVERDLNVHIVHDEMYETVVKIVVPKNTSLSKKQEKLLAEAMCKKGTRRTTESGWSPGAITKALESWAKKHTSHFDLTFRWNPDFLPSKRIQQAMAALNEWLSGEKKAKNFKDLKSKDS